MEKILETNQKTYDLLAKEYENKVDMRKDYNESFISQFIKHINTGNQVLDIGCAVGLEMSIFIKKGFDTTGIEISQEMANFAQNRNPCANILVGNFMDVTFNKKFDAIFASAFIHLFPKEETKTVLIRIKDLLVENGVAFITTTKSEESKEGWFEKTDYTGDHKRFRKYWTKSELEEAIKEANLEIDDYYEKIDPYNKEWMVFTVKNV